MEHAPEANDDEYRTAEIISYSSWSWPDGELWVWPNNEDDD